VPMAPVMKVEIRRMRFARVFVDLRGLARKEL